MSVFIKEEEEKFTGGRKRFAISPHHIHVTAGRAEERRRRGGDGQKSELEERKTRWEPNGEGNEGLDSKR